MTRADEAQLEIITRRLGKAMNELDKLRNKLAELKEKESENEELRKALEEIRAVCNPHNSVDESRAVLALRIADAAIEACARDAIASKDYAND